MGQASSTETVPATMKRLVLTTPDSDPTKAKLAIEVVPVPTPGKGEVLIRVVATPVNPSDYGIWTRTPQENCPLPMGKEGSGIVVASGGGLGSPAIGTKVGFGIQTAGQGSWSEYVVVNSMRAVFPMPVSLAIEDAASFFVNPFTAVGIIDTARKVTANNTFVHMAAASSMGQMMVKLAKVSGDVTIICVVRREEQAELLRGVGAKHVVVTGKTDAWKSEITKLMKELKCTCVFDPIGGNSTGQMLSLLPNKGKIFVYGGLSGPVAGVEVTDLIYNQKQIHGWWLTEWITGGGVVQTLARLRSTTSKVTAGLAGGWSSSTFADTTLETMHGDFIKQQAAGATGTKMRIRFDTSPADTETPADTEQKEV